MIEDNRWLTYVEYLPVEMIQSREEGRDISQFQEEIEMILNNSQQPGEAEKAAYDVLDRIEKIPVNPGYPYQEPNEIENIRRLRDASGGKTYSVSKSDMEDKIHGAWMGRCIGCLLGQPIEGWNQKRIEGFLKDTGNYPVKTYLSSDQPQEIIERYNVSNDGENAFCDTITHWINNIDIMPEDDDTNYTVIGLKVLEAYGKQFTSDHIAGMWLDSLPMWHVSTAERVAYKNIVNLVEPPRSGWWKNPYREWIGAQIRADIYGYVCPGNPQLAAELAWKDARISHTKNGIYGAMFVAAMLAAAYSLDSPDEIISAGLSEIPSTSRLYERVKEVIGFYSSGKTFEEVNEWLHRNYDETNSHDWCHTITNALVVAIALLYGKGDFEKSIGIAMLCGFDTDCNGATVGSITGLVNGYSDLPENWIAPVGDLLNTGVSRFATVSISEMTKRTLKIIEKEN